MTTATAADDKPRTHKGLAGVIADTTAISKVVPDTNSHRGYPVQELAAPRRRSPVRHWGDHGLWHTFGDRFVVRWSRGVEDSFAEEVEFGTLVHLSFDDFDSVPSTGPEL